MPIVRFHSDFSHVPADAHNVGIQAPGFNMPLREEDLSDTQRQYPNKMYGPYCVITWETHVGLCIRDYERNGYHDSDFHMLVWNAETGKPEDICFASTRGWSYPSYASRVDATPEVMAAYNAYKAANERRRRVTEALARRAKKIEIARAIGETNYRNLRKLEAVVPGGKWAATIDLLTNPRIRSDFKKSLRLQIINWYRDPNPKYATPLSRRQWEYV